MAGGPSTPALAAAVSRAGGLGFLAAGYLPSATVAEQIAELREATARPFGMNVLAPPAAAPDPSAVESYAARLRPEAGRADVALGEPRTDDDGWEDKLALALAVRERAAVVSFTFGCPVLTAGARAAQPGTAFALTPEAATSPAHRAALHAGRRIALTRAFTGRTARGIVNRFLEEHDTDAPSAYPAVRHVTAPLRAAGRERGDAEVLNLWAGQAHALTQPIGAGELVGRLDGELRAALADAAGRWA